MKRPNFRRLLIKLLQEKKKKSYFVGYGVLDIQGHIVTWLTGRNLCCSITELIVTCILIINVGMFIVQLSSLLHLQ
jgi:hypothetical protein